jgi:hypothetical protein
VHELVGDDIISVGEVLPEDRLVEVPIGSLERASPNEAEADGGHQRVARTRLLSRPNRVEK